MFYIINNEKLTQWADFNFSQNCQETDIITKQELDEHPNKVIVENNILVLNPNYEEEERAKEREAIMHLSLTAADVERAIYKDKGLDFDDILKLVEEQGAGIDIKALKIEFKANNFYRGNQYVVSIGSLLGYTSDDLDYLFQNKEFPTK